MCKINTLWIPAFAGMTTWRAKICFFSSLIVCWIFIKMTGMAIMPHTGSCSVSE